MDPLIDTYGRVMDYLRLSVTDRCNLRCNYCMPCEGIQFSERKSLLSYEEMLRLSGIFKKLGVKKIRITGGEPFVRKDLPFLLRSLRNDIGIEGIHLTTNGTFNEIQFKILKEIQIDSVNLSLDTLDRENFRRITRRDQFEKVWATFEKLISNNIETKINVVVQRGMNDHEIFPFVQLTEKYPVSVRFIETMPFNGSDENVEDRFMNYKEIVNLVLHEFTDAVKLNNLSPSSAINYDIPGFAGNFAVIPAYSRSLCGQCNRIRLTATGDFKTCLYADPQLNLRDLLREGKSDIKIVQMIQDTVKKKHLNGFEAQSARENQSITESMVSIGG